MCDRQPLALHLPGKQMQCNEIREKSRAGPQVQVSGLFTLPHQP